MASGVYTSGLAKICGMSPAVSFLSDTIKVMLLGTATAYTFNKDHDFVSEGGANDPDDSEISTTNYTGGFGGGGRKTLASKTISANDTSDRVEFDAADVTWTALGPPSGGPTLAAAVILKEITNDAASPMFCYQDFTDTQVNGGDVTLQFASGGFMQINT